MIQNRLKDRDRGGYTSDRYRPHDNYTNAFNMLAQIGLAEKEVTNSRHNAATQAANAYTARKEQEFKRDSWVTDKKLKLSNEYRGEHAALKEQAMSTLDSRMTSFRTDHLEKFLNEVDKLKTHYGEGSNDFTIGLNTLIDDFNNEYTEKYKTEVNQVNEEYSGVMNDLIKYADTDSNVFDLLGSKWNPPSSGYGKKKNLILEPIENIIAKYNSFSKNNDLDNTEVQQNAIPPYAAATKEDDLNNQKNSLVTINPKIWDEMMQEEQVGLESHEDTLDQNLELTSPQYHPNITNLLITQTPTQVEKNPFWQHYDGPSHKGFQNLGKKLAKFFTKWGGWVNTTEESFDSLLGKFNTGGNR